jgi:L-asparaginase II
MPLRIEVRVWRGTILESWHRVQAAVCDADGRLEAGTERPDLVTTFRSAAKPFQLLPLVERGHAARWGLTDEHLAVMASSHTGSSYHLRLVGELLERLGLGDEHLACGYHAPIDAEALAEVLAHPERRSAIHNNCSGKHAGMLCLALSEGWPVRGYERADHPVQQLMRVTVAEICGLAPEALAVAVDGCSVSVFGLPLSAMARGYARLAQAGSDGEGRQRALRRIRDAMAAYPVAVGGAERFSTVLTERTGSRLIAKGGAEGLECVAIARRGLGVAVKSEDGQARGVAPATIAVLEHLGELEPAERSTLAEIARPVVVNPAGLEVGSLEVVVEGRTAALSK